MQKNFVLNLGGGCVGEREKDKNKIERERETERRENSIKE
jgi:hypothetical protein